MSAKEAVNGPLPGEEKLVRRVQQGDAGAFRSLYDAYAGRIYRYVFFRVTDDAAAQDITAQTFLKAWDRLDSFESSGAPFAGWLYRIAHSAIIDHGRVTKAQGPVVERMGMELELETLRLRTALQKLTGDQQEVIILKFMLGLDTPGIALHLGKEPRAVQALQMHALQILARSLQPETE
jgi:RNA polymerase sigma-70 factor (ECF subfamily)